MKDQSLNIIYVVDKNFIVPLVASITSLLVNNDEFSNLYIIHDETESDIIEEALKPIRNSKNLTIKLIKYLAYEFDSLPISKHVTKAAYLKLVLSKLIPKEVEVALYLDCDTIITGSIKELFNYNFCCPTKNKELSLFAVKDPNAFNEIERFKKLGTSIEFYFNSGVMLINLNKWRSDNVYDQLLKNALSFKEYIKWYEQDVLNLFFKDEVGRLSTTFNSFAKIKKANVPLIIHYSGDSKPWHYIDNSPYKELFWYYLNLTQYKGCKLEKITIQKILKKYYRKFRSVF